MKNAALLLVALFGCSHAQHASGGGGGGGEHGGGTGPVPPEVRKTVEATLGPTAQVTSEHENGVEIYEAARDTKLEVELSAAGQLQRTEVAVPVATLPTAIATAMSGKGAITEAEVVLLPTGVAFEIEIGDTEYVVDASGQILSSERETPDDDKD
ncbi:MAG TPA: hypothetical protein VLB44_15900 [Kofleriaceae bacterium]|nr:hypothetical protein [Kofleriaceae bacterium]